VLQLRQAAASLHFVPGLREAAPHRFLAVGGANGSLLLLCPETGRLVAQHDTGAWTGGLLKRWEADIAGLERLRAQLNGVESIVMIFIRQLQPASKGLTLSPQTLTPLLQARCRQPPPWALTSCAQTPQC
jgi:hypothetical protein